MEQVSLYINGKKTQVSIEKNWTLLFVLREVLGLTGAKCGCSTGDCGACKVIIDGEAVNSCLVAFIDAGAVQCGYCTPGMVMSAKALLDRIENPTEEEIRNNGISNNLCRCTGYVKIVEAIRLAARRMMEAKAGGKKEES